jgi:hypothetical protein
LLHRPEFQLFRSALCDLSLASLPRGIRFTYNSSTTAQPSRITGQIVPLHPRRSLPGPEPDPRSKHWDSRR